MPARKPPKCEDTRRPSGRRSDLRTNFSVRHCSRWRTSPNRQWRRGSRRAPRPPVPRSRARKRAPTARSGAAGHAMRSAPGQQCAPGDQRPRPRCCSLFSRSSRFPFLTSLFSFNDLPGFLPEGFCGDRSGICSPFTCRHGCINWGRARGRREVHRARPSPRRWPSHRFRTVWPGCRHGGGRRRSRRHSARTRSARRKPG